MASPSKVLVIDIHSAENHAAVEALIDAALAAESASLVATDVEAGPLFFRGQDASTVFVSLAPNGAGSSANIREIAASDTVLLTDGVILADSTGGAVVVTLPPAATATNRIFTIKNIEDTGGVSVDPDGTEQLDRAGAGVATALTNVNDFISVISDGTEWWIV